MRGAPLGVLRCLAVLGCLAVLACDGRRGDSGGPQTPVPPEALPATDWGPFAVGMRTLEVEDADRGKPMVLELWYPATVADGRTPDTYIPWSALQTQAHRGVPIDLAGAPYPLVGFSHGLSAVRYQSPYLCEFLASHGFVVVAPDHSPDTILDLLSNLGQRLTAEEMAPVLAERPGDVSFAVDTVIDLALDPASGLAGLVDGSGWIAAGHSAGGYTTLAVSGAVHDLGFAADFCQTSGARGCRELRGLDWGMLQDLLDENPQADDRVVAAVPMSPGLWYAFGENGAGLSAMPPTLALAGDRDTLLGYEDEAVPTMNALPAGTLRAVFHNYGHYAFTNLCEVFEVFPPEVAGEFFIDCVEEAGGYGEIDLAHTLSRSVVTAWMRRAWGSPGPGDAALLSSEAWADTAALSLAETP